MLVLTQMIVVGLMMALTAQVHGQENPKRIDVTVLNSPENQCPTSEESEDAQETISQAVRAALLSAGQCGDQHSGWRPIAFYNMTDSNYNCPSGPYLTSRTTSKRLCEPRHGGTCSSTMFSAIAVHTHKFVEE